MHYKDPEARIVGLETQVQRLAAKPRADATDREELAMLVGEIHALEGVATRLRDEEIHELQAAVKNGGAVRLGSTHVDPEFRAFVDPENKQVNEFWVKPSAAMTMQPLNAYLTGTSPGSGLFTDEMYLRIIEGLVATSGVLEGNPTIVMTDHLRDIVVPVLTGDATATLGVEGSDATAAESTGAVVTLGKYRYDGKFSVSAECIMASEFDVDDMLARYAARSIGNKVAERLVLGNGSTAPHGLFVAATVGVTTSVSATAVAPAELLALTKSVGKGYRKTSSLVASDALHTSMLQWRDDSGAGAGTGNFLMRSMESGGFQFAGRPVYVEPQADQGGISAAEVHAVFGDLSGYIIRFSPFLFHKDTSNPLVVTYRFALWMDAKLADTGCCRSLKTKA